MTVTIDWENLGFSYMKLPYRYLAHFKNGQWDQGELTEDATLHISESSPSLHYGQQAFEGLKAYRTKDGSVQLFRPDENAKRLQRTCDRLLMPQVPTDMFVEACKAVVRANEEYVPPYGIGGTLYLRPLLIGVGDIIGVKPAEEYIFTIFAMPVVQVRLRLVETMLQVSYQEKWPSHVISQMLSIWTHQLIQRLKKSDQLTSLELQLIMNL